LVLEGEEEEMEETEVGETAPAAAQCAGNACVGVDAALFGVGAGRGV